MLPEEVVADLSHDQEYMYDMCRCVINGKLTDDMKEDVIANMIADMIDNNIDAIIELIPENGIGYNIQFLISKH